jgi:hypothetical protein
MEKGWGGDGDRAGYEAEDRDGEGWMWGWGWRWDSMGIRKEIEIGTESENNFILVSFSLSLGSIHPFILINCR